VSRLGPLGEDLVKQASAEIEKVKQQT